MSVFDGSVAGRSSSGRVIEPGQAPRHRVLGTDIEVLLTGADTGDRLAVCRITARPGDGVPPHRHIHEDETFILTEGRLRVTVGDQTRIIGPGAVALLPMDVPHSWWVEGDEPATILVLGTPAGLDRFFPELAANTVTPAGAPTPMDAVIATSLRYGIVFEQT